MSKLTLEQVQEIQYLYSTGQHTQKALSKMFSVSQGSICYAISGKTYAK